MSTIEIKTAEGCAWRARYLYINGQQVAHVSIDPRDGTDPQCSGSLGRFSFRFRLPRIPWRMATRNTLFMHAYQASQRFWHGVDGRYGWGTEARVRLQQTMKGGA
jgi:hypothetical protein